MYEKTDKTYNRMVLWASGMGRLSEYAVPYIGNQIFIKFRFMAYHEDTAFIGQQSPFQFCLVFKRYLSSLTVLFQ